MYKWVVLHVDVIDYLQWISAVEDAGLLDAVLCVISYMSTCSQNGGHYKLYIFYKCRITSSNLSCHIWHWSPLLVSVRTGF